MYDVLKPIAREITNSYHRDPESVGIMKEVVKKIVKLYIWLFRNYESTSACENAKELLARDSFLFLKKEKSGKKKYREKYPSLEGKN